MSFVHLTEIVVVFIIPEFYGLAMIYRRFFTECYMKEILRDTVNVHSHGQLQFVTDIVYTMWYEQKKKKILVISVLTTQTFVSIVQDVP